MKIIGISIPNLFLRQTVRKFAVIMGFWEIFLESTKENVDFQKLPKTSAKHFMIDIKHLEDVLRCF